MVPGDKIKKWQNSLEFCIYRVLPVVRIEKEPIEFVLDVFFLKQSSEVLIFPPGRF